MDTPITTWSRPGRGEEPAMAEMHRIESPEIVRALPARRKRPNVIDMSVAWSRTGDWVGPLPAPEPPQANPTSVSAARSVANRSHVNHAQEHAMVMNSRLRVLNKIASHRQRSSQLTGSKPSPSH